ncbi:hypothetical protein [Robertkochia aurantiaca]|uniref:hypothetical protein n=1 Tax=Robertkochia aurantiaca TaxID=2873700 RepID=UPI001CCB67DB|nr:hypothetical protein [Robertkochia sp. 3YJGBD-33]
MKNFCLILILGAFMLTGCRSSVAIFGKGPGHAPPGQVKKATGAQSAKEYAPGQQKNKNKNKNKNQY